MNVWIFQTGEPLIIDRSGSRPMRAMNMAAALISAGHNVTIWSSDFYHQEKRHRFSRFKVCHVQQGLTIYLIPSIGYHRHMSLMRLVDHIHLAINLLRGLHSSNLPLPQISFIGYPPIEFAAAAAFYMRIRNIPFCIDVKDLWPDIFVEKSPQKLKSFVRLVLSPYYLLAKNTLASADFLTSTTSSYLSKARELASTNPNELDRVLPLAPNDFTPSKKKSELAIEWFLKHNINLSNSYRIQFIGSLSSAFDFKPLSDALRILKSRNFRLPEVVICGDGPERENLINLFDGLENVIFPGWVDDSQASILQQHSCLAVAPYKNLTNFTLNFPNKIIDSLRHGLPIITSLRGEVGYFLSKTHTGIVCDESGDSWAHALETLLTNQSRLTEFSINSRREYLSRFTFDSVYQSFVTHLEGLTNA